jgi:hypothetical protein
VVPKPRERAAVDTRFYRFTSPRSFNLRRTGRSGSGRPLLDTRTTTHAPRSVSVSVSASRQRSRAGKALLARAQPESSRCLDTCQKHLTDWRVTGSRWRLADGQHQHGSDQVIQRPGQVILDDQDNLVIDAKMVDRPSRNRALGGREARARTRSSSHGPGSLDAAVPQYATAQLKHPFYAVPGDGQLHSVRRSLAPSGTPVRVCVDRLWGLTARRVRKPNCAHLPPRRPCQPAR